MSDIFPQALFVGGSSVEPYAQESPEEIDRDPRGLLLMYEPPRPNCRYIIGMDTAEGITGWTRANRTDNDHKTDNSAIEIFRPDGAVEKLWKDEGHTIPEIDPATKRQATRLKDVQVAEWAGPCDPVEAARIANVLGRIYKGTADEQAELIWEAWPGCGMLATQELVRLGYANLWMWTFIADVAEESNHLGWRSSRESMKLLWQRTRRHLMLKKAVIRSRFLLEEYSNAEIDMEKMRARAAYGFHDDRFMSANLCFWGGHKWTYSIEESHEEVRDSPAPLDLQRFAPTLDTDAPSFRAWKEDAVASWLDED